MNSVRLNIKVLQHQPEKIKGLENLRISSDLFPNVLIYNPEVD